jgi:hypothetical protein
MESKKMEKQTNNGLGLGGVLFVIFLVLKLAGIGSVANWSWLWVFSPLWIPISIGIILFIVIKILSK